MSRSTGVPGCSRLRPLALVPAVLVVVLGCHSLRLLPVEREGERAGPRQPPPVPPPGKYSLRIPPYVFISDFELKPDLPLFQDLARLRDQVYKDLQLDGGNAVIRVYLFEDKKRFDQFIAAQYPALPPRRAFFVANDRTFGREDLLVYTYRSDRIRQDLRHELTHALLHSVLRVVPIWLDEGLAEYFELPPEQEGVNASHLDHLCHPGPDGYRPNLARLEKLTDVGQMQRPEYREAWAWVHLMMRSRPEARAALLGYLRYLRGLREEKDPREPLGPRLAAVFASPDDALAAHLERLEAAGGKGGEARR